MNNERVEQEDGEGCKVRCRSRRNQIPASNVLAENRAFLGEVNQGMAETQCPFRELCSRHESKIHSYLPQIEGSLQDHKYCVAAFHTTSN